MTSTSTPANRPQDRCTIIASGHPVKTSANICAAVKAVDRMIRHDPAGTRAVIVSPVGLWAYQSAGDVSVNLTSAPSA